ncbi:MAG: hypothetical protein ACYSUM_13045 [Planctomycetota bacterium]
MKIPCGYCREPLARMRLCRVGNRLVCPTCFRRLKEAPVSPPATGSALAGGDLHDLFRRTVLVTFAALAGKTLLYVPLFLWARHGDVGAAALRGAVAADVFTWILFSVLEWPFRRVQVTAGAVFELVLVVIYLYRDWFFEITSSIDSTAMSVVFFFMVLFGKTGLWCAERVLEFTGVKETASP